MPQVVILPHVIEQKLKEDDRQEVIDFTFKKIKTELFEEIDNAKSEIIKWMFIFSILNVITIIGGIAGILKIAKVF